MKHRFALSPRAATFVLVAALGASTPFLTSPLQAAPKKEQLQIWPGRRVLLVLPVAVSPTWNADAQLGRAILPLAQPQLQKALYDTGKFSTTLPYRFDPVLRRGLTEKQIAENDITALLADPSLTTSRPVIDKLNFDQPVMTTEIFLEELTIGGTAKLPTVQIRASGKLYEQGNPDPIKTVSIRSNAVSGKTPSDRLIGATGQAFREIAAAFVEPPAAFDLPLPIESVTSKDKAGRPTTQGSPANGSATGSNAAGTNSAPMALPAPLPSIAPPNSLSSAPGAPFVPQLPAAQPPLGVTAGEDTTVGR
ncbi:hypothetical protein B1R32_12318 [Abditibacterium utsteinense]|uniref:Uncharacterized protein n=1 Tax=Abditibacterium utsteinense TaxID=1960156 RepID=A0A2S8SPK5_9BACT|nr:hypothetical protein [Abditibacterium utsteinense]PQV62733.1 hypothetical protein B1R32_12318 [Abditibacterium utsteinense]